MGGLQDGTAYAVSRSCVKCLLATHSEIAATIIQPSAESPTPCCLLQKVNEKLSGNVLRNWDRFVDGLQDVTVIQGNIEVAASRLTKGLSVQPAGHL